MGTIQGLFRGIAPLHKNMRHYIVKLQQADNSIVNSVIIASSAESAQAIVLKYANKIVTSSYSEDSKVFIHGKELKLIGVEEWENNSLKVVKGQKKYGVIVYINGKPPKEMEVENLAGSKSVYSFCVKSSRLEGQAIMFIRELEHLVKVGGYTFDMLSQTIVECPYAKSKDGVLVIPETINGVEVKRIGEFAFYSNQIQSLVIPDSVTEIGEYAFAFNQIQSIVIPDSVTSIGDYAFDSNQIQSIVISDSVTKIGKGAFRFNQIRSIVIPESVTEINGIFEDFEDFEDFEEFGKPSGF